MTSTIASPDLTKQAFDATDELLALPAGIVTLDGFRQWVTSDAFEMHPYIRRASYVDGEVLIDMSPEELETHNKVKLAFFRVGQLANEADLGEFYPDGALVTHEAAHLSTVPDSVFVSWHTFQSGQVRLTPRTGAPDQFVELLGSPDWVLEIVSISSRKKDTSRLREAYHRAGVREYWLVNAMSKAIDFQILVHKPAGYEAVAPVEGWLASPVFERQFRLDRSRNVMGRWRYQLQVR